MEIMKDFGKKYEETNGHMATIASCFKIESEEAKRRMKVFNELLIIEGLFISERIKVGELLTVDTHKCDYFYSLLIHYICNRSHVSLLMNYFYFIATSMVL